MPDIVIAEDNDTLCGIAVSRGFLNCDPLRAESANASLLNGPLKKGDRVTIPDKKTSILQKNSEKLHEFLRKGVPAASIRFVHGSKSLPYRHDRTSKVLEISNFVSNKAGADGSKTMPTGFGFNQSGHDDPDTFKIEVVDPDPRVGDSVTVELEALKPVYGQDGKVTRYESFTDAQAGLRKIKVACQKVSDPDYKGFRSRYLRLVTDEEDMEALSGHPVRSDGSAQGLFTSDMADGANGDADKVEILHQPVQATYVIKGCNAAGNSKCKVKVQAPIGQNRAWLKVAVHVMRKIPGNDASAVVTIADANKRIRKQFRRVYAQIGLAPKIMQATRLVDPMENLISVSDDNGADADGGGTGIEFSIRVQKGGAPDSVIDIGPIVQQAGDSAADTAAAIATAINNEPGLLAQSFQNPPTLDTDKGSADVLITATGGGRIIIENLVEDDPAQIVTVGRVTASHFVGWAEGGALNWNAGSIMQRTMLQNYDTGSDRLDFVVVDDHTSGDRGQAMMPAAVYGADKQAISQITMSAFLAAESMDGTANNPFSFPHEAGHVLLDLVHTSNRTQLMAGGGTSGVNAVDGTKRFSDSGIAFQDPDTPPLSQENRIRDKAAGVLEAF